MKLKLKVFQCLCECENFKINGKGAYIKDFGLKEDTNPSITESYGCGNMEFIKKSATDEILDKYNITLSEYNEICDKLEQKLSFGKCGWCI